MAKHEYPFSDLSSLPGLLAPGFPKLCDGASVRFLGENSPASALAVTGENGRIGIVLNDQAFAMRNWQDAMRGSSAEFLRGCSHQHPLAPGRRKPLELRILEAEHRDAGLEIDAAGAENAEIWRNLLHIPQRLGA